LGEYRREKVLEMVILGLIDVRGLAAVRLLTGVEVRLREKSCVLGFHFVWDEDNVYSNNENIDLHIE
jgi:hypothetical protein